MANPVLNKKAPGPSGVMAPAPQMPMRPVGAGKGPSGPVTEPGGGMRPPRSGGLGPQAGSMQRWRAQHPTTLGAAKPPRMAGPDPKAGMPGAKFGGVKRAPQAKGAPQRPMIMQ